jgi:hypothetical protein
MSYSDVGRKIVNEAPGFIIRISCGSCVGSTRGSASEVMALSRKRVLDTEENDEPAVKRYCSLITSYGYPLVDGIVAYTPSNNEIHIPGAIIHNASHRVYCAGGLVTWLDAETDVWRQTSIVNEAYDISYVAPADVSISHMHSDGLALGVA